MPLLLNKATGQLENIDDEQLINQGVASGQYAFKNTDKIFVTNPYGEKKYLPGKFARDAVNQGYTIHNKRTEMVERYVDENKGVKGAAKVFFGQMLDEAAMGVPELVYDKTKHPLDVAKKEALKKHFDALNIAGGVTGAAASMLYGGPLWKGAAKAGEATTRGVAKLLSAKAAGEVGETAVKSIAKNIVAKGAGTGVEGALLSSPIAITEAVLGDPEQAAETMMWGVGLGSLFGGATEMGSSLAKLTKQSKVAQEAREKLSTAISERKDLRSLAEDKAVEALNPNLGQRERLKALEEVVSETGEVLSLKPTENLKRIGRDLLDNDIITTFASKGDIYERLVAKNSELRDEVGNLISRFDDEFGDLARIRTDDVIQSVRAGIEDNPYFQTAAYKPIVARVEKHLENLAERGETLSLREANREKTAMQKLAEAAYKSQNAGIDVTTAEVVAVIPREFNKLIRGKTRELNKDLAEELLEKQRLLGNLTQAENITKKSAAREARNNDFGLNSFIMGGGGMTAGAVLGGAPGAVIGGIGLMMGRELARRFGDQAVASAFNKYGGMLFAEKAMKKAADKMDRIPQIIRNMADPKKLPPKKTSALYGTIRMFEGDKKSKEIPKDSSPKAVKEYKLKKVKEIRDKIIQFAHNPQYTTQMIGERTAPISNEGAPEIAGKLSAKMAEAISYLAGEAPKDMEKESLFAPEAKFEPSEYEVNKFLQKVQVVENPMTVFDELEAGTLTMHHMDALKTIYPQMYGYMLDKVTRLATDEKISLPYQKRLSLSILMGAAVDPSLKPDRIRGYQAMFSREEEEQSGEGGESINLPGDVGKSLMTDAQRLA